MIRLGILAAMLIACDGDKSGDTDADNANCGVTIDSTYPTGGSTTFYIQDQLEFELSDEDPTAAVVLKDSAGAEVAGTSTIDGTDISFKPNAALSPSTAYTAELTYCGDANPVPVEFTTSGLGTDLSEGPSSLIDQTFAVDLATGNFVKPAGIGSLLSTALENKILIGITNANDSKLEFRGALSETGNDDQDFCTETLEGFEAADFSNAPYFEIPEGDINITIAGFTANIKNLRVAGTFASDGSYFGGGELSGKLDARDLVDIVGGLGIEAEDADDLCTLILGFGVSCEACDDGEEYCVSLEVNRLTAQETGDTLGLVCSSDCHESCDNTERAAACTDETYENQADCEAANETWIGECETKQSTTLTDIADCPSN